MGLADIKHAFFGKPAPAETDDYEYIAVGDVVTVMTPSGTLFNGIIADTDADNQLAKVAYLLDNRLSFMWMPPHTMYVIEAA